MISNFDTDKALLAQAKIIATANGYRLVTDGESYQPDPNELYIKEHVINGDDESRGIEDGSPDVQIGIYQLTVFAPKANEGAKWQSVQVCDVLRDGFARGTELIFNQQMVRMRSSSLKRLGDDDTHKIYALSITFTVIN